MNAPKHRPHLLRGLVLTSTLLLLAACGAVGTKLQPPTASIQQITLNSDGSWTATVRFQNFSYDTGMHVYTIKATLDLGGATAGNVDFAPALDIPEADADIATTTFKPDAKGAAALAGAHGKAVQYALKGTLSVGKGNRGTAQPFPLDAKGYISPVPGVSNIWR